MMKIVYPYLSGLMLLIFLLYAAPVYAADDDNILKQLLEAARKNDDQLKIAKQQFDAAKAQAGQGLAPVLPQLRLSAQYSQRDNECADCPANNPGQPDSSGTATRVELSQTLYEPAKWRTYTAAKARAEQFGYLYGAAQLNLVTRLLDQYLDILAETDNLRTLESQRDRLNKQLEVISARAAAGTRSQVDLEEIRSSAALSESQYLLSRISLRTFYEGLSASLKLQLKNLPPIKSDLKMPPLESSDPDYWVDLALQQNLNLLAAEAAVKAAEEDVKISNRGHVPTFDLFVSYLNNDNTFEDYSATSTQTESGIRFSVPLYIGGQVFAGKRSAKARLQEAQSRRELTIVEIKTIIPSLVRRIGQGEELIAASQAALEARRSVVAQTELRYNAGAADITDLLLAYERLYETERSYYASLYSHIRNYADLHIRSGSLDEEKLGDLYDIGDLSNYDSQTPLY